jgi:hypothetical protein
MQAGDYGERKSEPWTYRERVLPLRTYSGRVVYNRKPHRFTMRDAERILAKIEPPEVAEVGSWVDSVFNFLRSATITMLEKLLPFLDGQDVENFYEICIEILDRFFRIDTDNIELERAARRMIINLADRFGLAVTIKK